MRLYPQGGGMEVAVMGTVTAQELYSSFGAWAAEAGKAPADFSRATSTMAIFINKAPRLDPESARVELLRAREAFSQRAGGLKK